MAQNRCCGITRKGARCSITGASRLTDDRGRLVGLPLQHGGNYCRLHARPFCHLPAGDVIEHAIILLLDLETTGVDVASDQIVELAAYHAPSGRESKGAAFSTVVRASAEDTASDVHGIGPQEISQGLPFGVAWSRFVDFVEHLQRVTAPEDSDSECELEDIAIRFSCETPTVILAAHNGIKFDFAMILFECARHGCSWAPLVDWLFVDTLSVVQAIGVASLGGCAKLQCLVRGHCIGCLQAHRALDDCIELRAVVQHVADLVGVPLLDLLRPLAVRLDLPASIASMSAM